MKIEHVALNVKDAREVAQWYVSNLGFTLVKQMEEAPYTTFMADEAGGMVEIYSNPGALVPNYKSMHPLILHLAFVSENPDTDRKRLEAAGATFVEELKLPDGSHLIMMRDPFGLAIQFCKRAEPF